MISAALDSSFGIALAVAENDRLVVEANRPFQGRRNDENLVPWIREALANAELNLSSIVRWNVGRGPGSFTGIRVGIAFVKGVCMQTGAAYRGVPSSLALACAASNELNVGDHIAVVHDARRGQLIATHYKVCDEGMVDEQTPASVINPENLEQSFSHVKRLVSNQAEHIRHLLPPSLQKRLTAAEHVEARFLLNPPTKPWPATRQEQEASCEPIYVRPPVFVKARSAGSPLC